MDNSQRGNGRSPDVFVIVNRTRRLEYKQTTSILIAALVRQKRSVHLVDVESVSGVHCDGGMRICANALKVPQIDDCQAFDIQEFVRATTGTTRRQIEPGDCVLIRTSPGKNSQNTIVHESFLQLAVTAQRNGVRFFNAPSEMRFWSNKAALLEVPPSMRPPMIVSSDVDQMLKFMETSEHGCVIKPLFGSRGDDVIRVSRVTENLEEILDAAYGTAPVSVQHFLPTRPICDKRVLVIHGEILEVEGQVGGIERRPAGQDFRANLHAGGSAYPLVLTENERAVATFAAELLNRRGITLAGVDLVGEKIIEFNVFSTGGLYDAIRFTGVRFDDAIVSRLFG